MNGDSERACVRISIVSEVCHVPALLLVLQMGGDSTSRLCQTERKHWSGFLHSRVIVHVGVKWFVH